MTKYVWCLSLVQERGEAFVVKSMERLRSAMTPRYQNLLQQIGRIEGGVKFIVDMRSDLLVRYELLWKNICAHAKPSFNYCNILQMFILFHLI